MNALITYLNFDGNARDAMTFYQKCLGAELHIQTSGDVKAPGPPGSENRVIHARLTKGGKAVLMASDTMPGSTLVQGNNFLVNIDCESIPEIERLFAAFSAGGKVMMPLQDTFWGARFGMLTDKFGVQWMFNYDLAKKG
ncbi:MAG: VOC family protein [Gemmatimonadaceae bacterium]